MSVKFDGLDAKLISGAKFLFSWNSIVCILVFCVLIVITPSIIKNLDKKSKRQIKCAA